MEFEFNTTSMQEVFDNATYNTGEYFGQYGLNKDRNRKNNDYLINQAIDKRQTKQITIISMKLIN